MGISILITQYSIVTILSKNLYIIANTIPIFIYESFISILVVVPSADTCRYENEVVLSTHPGFISNTVSTAKGVGTITCPWKIKLAPGQRINLTLYDFSQPTFRASDIEAYGICYQYGIITEKNAVMRNKRICGGNQRLRSIYESRSNMIEIRMVEGTTNNGGTVEMHHFMLKYEGENNPYPKSETILSSVETYR